MAGAESSDFSAIIMLCDSVACPEGKLYIQLSLWLPAQPTDGARPQDLPPAGRAIPGGLNMVMASPLQGHR